MSEPFIGQIMLVPYNFAPRGWAFCNGQTTFALPDLRGRVPISSGQGPGLQSYDLGQVGGVENVTLTINEMPMHNHLVGASNAEVPQGGTPANQVPALGSYYAPTPDTTMSPTMIQPTGGNQPHENRQPYLTLNYCIAMEGIFPSRS